MTPSIIESWSAWVMFPLSLLRFLLLSPLLVGLNKVLHCILSFDSLLSG